MPKSKDDLQKRLEQIFSAKKFRLHYEAERLCYRKIGRSTDERTLIASLVKSHACVAESMNYLTPFTYQLSAAGKLDQCQISDDLARAILSLFNSLVLNYYIRNKISANVNLFYLYELPIPKLASKVRTRLVAAAEKLLTPRTTRRNALGSKFSSRKKCMG